MFPLIVAFILPGLAAAQVYPVLYNIQLSVAPSNYNPNVSFELKCTVDIRPNNIEYGVSFLQNGKYIGEYTMQGKRKLVLHTQMLKTNIF